MALSHQRNRTIALAVLLAVVVILSTAKLSLAQESSTLPAPALTAQAGNDAIELSWDAVDGAAHYQLAARPRNGEWQYPDNAAITATTYSHTGLTAATTYAYQVRAVSENGDTGEWSQRVSVTFAGVLVAPTLTLQASNDGFDLGWTTVSGAGAYQLFVWSGSGQWRQLGGGDLTGTTYTHPELAAGTTYHYTVRAVTASEAGPWSAQVSETAAGSQSATSTPTPTPTQQPASQETPTPSSLSAPGLTAQAGEGVVHLSWNAVPGAVRYELWTFTAAGGRQRLDDGSLTETTFTHENVEVGTTYHYTAPRRGPRRRSECLARMGVRDRHPSGVGNGNAHAHLQRDRNGNRNAGNVANTNDNPGSIHAAASARVDRHLH